LSYVPAQILSCVRSVGKFIFLGMISGVWSCIPTSKLPGFPCSSAPSPRPSPEKGRGKEFKRGSQEGVYHCILCGDGDTSVDVN